MAEPIRSVLLVDYESLQRSLAATVGETRLADRAAVWLAALEAGRLGPEGVRRRLMVKRCYAGPGVRGKQRDALTTAGFEVVDSAESGARSSADLHMAMDTVDALGKPDGYQEFILFSAASELAPLLARLKANKRVSVIYADAATPQGDRALADAIVESGDFIRLLAGEKKPPVEEAAAPPAAPSSSGASDRADIEAFARRIHAATSIPLFSPKTFAELFRHLTDEITANGYHFQSTARNVADRMVAGGRNVTRRQVVFIVKGLALKGHVFSTTDTPEKLAEVFREQAHYLIVNAGITLDEHQENLLSAWFLSRAPASAPAPLPATPEAPATAKAKIAETIEREVAKAIIRPPAPEKPKPQPSRPTEPAKPPQVKPVDMPKSAAKPMPFPSAREEAKAVIAARIAGAARMKPAGSLAPLPAKPAPAPPPAPPPAPVAEAKPVAEQSSETKKRSTQETSDALESSILAAIAEAVDVLVEDSDEDAPAPPPAEREPERQPPPREPPAKKRLAGNNGRRAEAQPPTPPPAPQPPENDDGDSNDIGDQIQRIIASYNRNRTDE